MKFIEKLKQIFNTKNHKHEIVYQKALVTGVNGVENLNHNVSKAFKIVFYYYL